MPALKILLVEDSADDAELLALELADAGIEASWVRVDREAALKAALADGGHDLVVSDLGLPGFDGLEALRCVRARQACPSCSVRAPRSTRWPPKPR